jgi:hypothetical protein
MELSFLILHALNFYHNGFAANYFGHVRYRQKSKAFTFSPDMFDEFIPETHLQPPFEKLQFDTLHSWDFGWAILKPINIAKPGDEEIALSKRLSSGQKALYFFWYLDADVTNGGFIQFFANGKAKYIPAIKKGLEIIGDKAMLDLLIKAEQEYMANQAVFNHVHTREQFSALYKKLKGFEPLDNTFYKLHDATMDRIEAYARQHPEEFVNFI